MKDWLRQEMDFFPVTETLPEDIFLVSYPKSGNTWFRYLAIGATFGVNPGRVPPAVLNELSPDVHQQTLYHRFTTPMLIKSHQLPQPEYRRVVYLVRDGRDALVSYLHFIRHYENTVVDGLAAARTGAGLGAGQWHQHVEQWLANPYGADLLVIRYEDLLRDPVPQLERFCNFAGMARPRDMLEAAVRNSSFENLHQRELCDNPAMAEKSRDAFFFRRGEAGSHLDELPREWLNAFEASARPTLQRLGYDVEHLAAPPQVRAG
ncbi:MAG TPA: sulfotransferase domain-containing protein [Opitutales bacterium]|nr:sulfotransferase domain-containing protein [Opitutales bacterium]